uniref:Uncharacterized protein n=1 Tax=Spongospora subterranea TaxID=70186 RepID=A0A0H5R7V2_9EUKA|eukprot:CRZ09792.1 hypothetical protein [Spongospora subterranea]
MTAVSWLEIHRVFGKPNLFASSGFGSIVCTSHLWQALPRRHVRVESETMTVSSRLHTHHTGRPYHHAQSEADGGDIQNSQEEDGLAISLVLKNGGRTSWRRANVDGIEIFVSVI